MVGAVHAWGHVGPRYWGSRSGMQRGRGREVGGRWANGEGGGTVWLGGMYLEHRRVEGGRDVSHSRWMAAWCLTMSKSRRQVFLFRLTHFFLGPLMQVAWGACG